MIRYIRKLEFWNDDGEFKVVASTVEHPASMRQSMRERKCSNGTMLVVDVRGPKRKFTFKRNLDVRYAYIEQSPMGIDNLVRDILDDNFGVKVEKMGAMA